MKFTLILLSLVSAVSVSYAGQIPGSDNLSGLAAGSGVYSRSMLTDVEDGTGCTSTVRIDVSVNVEQKNITYKETTVDDNDQLSEQSYTIKVGRDSLGFYDAINGIRVYSVNGVKGNAVVSFERKDVSWLGLKGKWETYGSVISFTPGKVKIGTCTYRRVNP